MNIGILFEEKRKLQNKILFREFSINTITFKLIYKWSTSDNKNSQNLLFTCVKTFLDSCICVCMYTFTGLCLYMWWIRWVREFWNTMYSVSINVWNYSNFNDITKYLQEGKCIVWMYLCQTDNQKKIDMWMLKVCLNY